MLEDILRKLDELIAATEAGGGVVSSDNGLASDWISITTVAAAYSADDVMGGIITIPNMEAGELLITSINMYRGASAIDSGEGDYRLHLYNASPDNALADNDAWTIPNTGNNRAAYLGYIDLGSLEDLGGTIRLDIDGINKQVTCLGTNLYGYLTTRVGFTLTGTSIRLNVHAVRL